MLFDVEHINIFAKYFFSIELDLDEKSKSDIELVKRFLTDLQSDLFQSKMGYPVGSIVADDRFERDFLSMMGKITGESCEFHYKIPKIILTHDVDYIDMSVQYLAKTLLGRRKIPILSGEDFLSSLNSMLEYDKTVGLKSNCFVPVSGDFAPQSLKSYIINPSYSLYSSKGNELKSILSDFDVNVGLHGSVGSHDNNLFPKELKHLEEWMGRRVTTCRQHWLSIGSTEYFDLIQESGIDVDFTAGWNGGLGFRGGFLRMYPVPTTNGYVLEQPLSIMDGVLFDEMKLSTDEAFKASKVIIDLIYRKGGDLVLNWHGRSFSSRYSWSSLYKRLVEYALSKGFQS